MLRRIGLLSGGQAVAAVAGLLQVSIASHSLSAAGFGALATGLALAQGLRLALMTQSWQVVVRHGGRAPLRIAPGLALVDLLLAAGAAGLFLAILLGWGGSLGLDGEVRGTLAWLALGTCLQAADPWIGSLLAADRHGRLGALHACGALLRLGAVAGAAVGGLGLAGFVAAHVAGDACFLLLAVSLAIGRRGAAPGPAWCGPGAVLRAHPGAGRLLGSGLGSSAILAAGGVLDVPLAALILGPEEAGRYRLLRAVAGLAAVVALPVRQTLLARWRAAPERDLGPPLRRATWSLLAAGAVAIAAWSLPAEAAMTAAFGATATGLGPASAAMAAAATATIACAPHHAVLVARHHEGRVVAAQGAASLLHAALLPLLAATGGLAAACWSLPATQGCQLVLMAAAARRPARGSA